MKIIDGNEAAADIAYRLSEVAAIYPITPSSNMGEWADQWASEGRRNIWGNIPTIVEMQSEGGAAGAVHGALQAGSLATTFTASQGLLLMIPNMFKIAGELTAAVFHIAARSVATHALSIFGDHSDVMATRGTGWGMLCSCSVQEAADLAAIAHVATLAARVPFLHFFDGFRTSHEVTKADIPSDDQLRQLIDEKLILAHRERALTPDRPVLRGTAQNPDVFFQAREAGNRYYDACPKLVQEAMDRFAKITGRQYRIYEYHGAADAERVIVLMGSGAETAVETALRLNAGGAKLGVLIVRLYRPFDAAAFVQALPKTVKSIAVLDRTKEPGASGDPLLLDTIAALYAVRSNATVIGGRYGLSSKEFTPAMAKAVFDELGKPQPRTRFTVGINDDVSHLSLDYDPSFTLETDDTVRAVFYGLGADGTVGANKGTISIIGQGAGKSVQAYFVYDSKKAGAMTVSHLRFGPRPIHAPYLIDRANVVACHQTQFLERIEMLHVLAPGGVFLLNTPESPDKAWASLPREVQEQLLKKKPRFFVIDAYKTARDAGLGGRINTVMQACFFSISGVLPPDQAVEALRGSIRKAYGKKGEAVVAKNISAVDESLKGLHEVKLPSGPADGRPRGAAISPEAPDFVRNVLGKIYVGQGETLPVSAFPVDGTFPTDTARWEKRALAQEIPVWEPAACIQCAKCAIVCPHAAIRPKVYDAGLLKDAPKTLQSCEAKDLEWKGLKYTLQVSPDDCTGCGVCVDICPAKSKTKPAQKAIAMSPIAPIRDGERVNWDFFMKKLPDPDRRKIKVASIRHQQYERPLFEFSGACGGCGETPYLKLLSQLYGDRMYVANATGCSSIYGANLPTTPWAKNADGRGPAWSNSLFEDNAEFGLGMRVSIDQSRATALELLKDLSGTVGGDLAKALAEDPQKDESDIFEQRARVVELKKKLAAVNDPKAKRLLALADYLVRKSVWVVGGDGWAYDIGFGGLDHVLASGKNVKLLVLDTEVYSNTGGQKSKSTPRGAVARFSMGGNPSAKKDLGLIAMSYGNVYVAAVAMGAKDEHTLKAFIEAENYDGPAIIIAFAHCIAHGVDMTTAMSHQKKMVDTGRWLLYRYNPARVAEGLPPMTLDAKPAHLEGLKADLSTENRFRQLEQEHPEAAKELFKLAENDARVRFELFDYLSQRGAKKPA
ncbi:MAG: pyruvate:ferredoxin (flavodoxin) oxidoreductase [Elusimicrobia bacterium]|nr:pyruvate:ferredoxin (flavodoxin) oxidoreductase [Elusimicrobiota bacterium]